MECKADHSPKRKRIESAFHNQILNNDRTIVPRVYELFNIKAWCIVVAFISELMLTNKG